jgi:hypothetical protein
VPPRLSNTDGDPLVFHTLTFQIESLENALEALAPLAEGRSKEELLDEAEFDKEGKLRSVAFNWLKKGNSKISSWENTILGSRPPPQPHTLHPFSPRCPHLDIGSKMQEKSGLPIRRCCRKKTRGLPSERVAASEVQSATGYSTLATLPASETWPPAKDSQAGHDGDRMPHT